MAKNKPENKELDDLTKSLACMATSVSIIVWLSTLTARISKWVEFIASAVIGSAWMSLLLIYIWTEKLILLKIWATPIALALILTCIMEGWKALNKKPVKPRTHEEIFGKSKGKKFKVIDEKEPSNGKEFILYPLHAKLSDDKKLINIFQESQLEEVKCEE
jgi:hypothetical protein